MLRFRVLKAPQAPLALRALPVLKALRVKSDRKGLKVPLARKAKAVRMHTKLR